MWWWWVTQRLVQRTGLPEQIAPAIMVSVTAPLIPVTIEPGTVGVEVPGSAVGVTIATGPTVYIEPAADLDLE